MKKILAFIKGICWSFFNIKLLRVEEAQKSGLKHYTNIYGDAINHFGCRSLWEDQYGYCYGCEELLNGGVDLAMEQVKNQFPQLFENK